MYFSELFQLEDRPDPVPLNNISTHYGGRAVFGVHQQQMELTGCSIPTPPPPNISLN